MTLPEASRTGASEIRQRNLGSVPSQANRLVVVYAVARCDAADEDALLVQPIRRNEDRDGPSKRLLGRVSKETLCGVIPTCDRAVERLADDGVVGRLDNSGEQRLRPLRVALRCEVASRPR